MDLLETSNFSTLHECMEGHVGIVIIASFIHCPRQVYMVVVVVVSILGVAVDVDIVAVAVLVAVAVAVSSSL